MKNLELIKVLLTGWANQMYARFGYPVYLVGSVLTKEDPRDIDVRIVLSDESFEARYGSVKEWAEDTWRSEWRESRQKWAHDMGKISNDISKIYRKNIDFQVEPESWSMQHNGKSKLRLDSICSDGGD